MLQALFERYGTLVRFAGRELYAFWEPAGLAGAGEADLRALRVGYRARSLVRVSDEIASGRVDEATLRSAPTDEQRTSLLQLYGIGPASVGYIRVDVFHAFDELRYVSPWEIYSRLLFGTPVEEPVPVSALLDRIERWAPWRALAVHYLWEDLFRRHAREPADWRAPLIRL